MVFGPLAGIQATKFSGFQYFISHQPHYWGLMGSSADTAPEESSHRFEPESMHLEVICGQHTACIQVSPSTSLGTILRLTGNTADLSYMLQMQIGGKCVSVAQIGRKCLSIGQLVSETVNGIKGHIQLFLYPKLKCGMRKALGSFLFQAPEQPSEPTAAEINEDTVMDDRPEQAGGIRLNPGSFFFTAPEQPREPEQPCEPQQPREPSQEHIANLLGVVARNKKKKESENRGKQGSENRGKKTQNKGQKTQKGRSGTPKSKQKEKEEEFKWEPKFFFRDGINLLSTGRLL
jgi:hypothetical protein